MKKFLFPTLTLASLTLLMYACQLKEPVVTHPVINKTVMQVLRSDARFSTLVRAIERTNLTAAFDTPLNPSAAEGTPGDSITILAPTNEAFTRANIDVNSIDENTLRQVLLYHVPLVGRTLTTGTQPPSIPALPTTNIFGNGRVPNITGNTNEQFLRMRNTPSNLTEVLPTQTTPGSVPTNNSNRIFVSSTRINGIALITSPNLVCANGAIHVIDRVLMPTALNLYDVIAANPNYSLFKRAADRVGASVTSILTTTTNIRTVFVPTNEAFRAAGFDEAGIDAASTITLSNILRYHISSNNNRRFSVDITNGFNLFTDLGSNVNQQIFFHIDRNDFVINLDNNARMVAGVSRLGRADQLALNGVIHEVNKVLTVLVPTASTIMQRLNDNGLTLFRDAVTAAGLTFTTGSIGTPEAPLTAPANAPTFATPYTVFAPTNAAMEQAGYNATRIAQINAITDNANQEKVALRNFVRYHVIRLGANSNSNYSLSTTFTNGDRSTLLWNGVPFLPATGNAGTINATNSPTRQNFRQFNISVSGGVFAVRGTANAEAIPVLAAPQRDIICTDGIIHVIGTALRFQ